jgi:hypothetical protein
MGQAIECLPTNHEALSSNPSTKKKKKNAKYGCMSDIYQENKMSKIIHLISN